MRESKYQKQERNEQIKKDRQEGMTFVQLAAKYGISKTRARNICVPRYY
jgi:Mor family transcriptional regulator